MDPRCITTKAGVIALLAPMALTATSAFGQFATCGMANPPPGYGNCLVATTVPGCSNAACCNDICTTVDPFCCNTTWDGFCASQAAGNPLCAGGGGPADTCDTAQVIMTGATPFDTAGHATNGPAHAPCQEFADADQIVHNDMWFKYTHTGAAGDVTFSTCSDANFDTKVAVYKNSAGCTDAQLIAAFAGCDDDSPQCLVTGTANPFTSHVKVPAAANDVFLVRVGGFDDTEFGTGNINVLPQPGGGYPGCGTAPNPCGTASGGTPGCSGASCCNFICAAIDTFCCTMEWDDICANESAQCSDCQLDLTGCVSEGGACGVVGGGLDPNGGCNVTPSVFSPLPLNACRTGTISTGTTGTGAATRDTDWWEVTIPAGADTDLDGNVQLKVSARGEFPLQLFVDNTGPCGAGISGVANFSTNCNPANLTLTMAVNQTLRVFVSSGTAAGALFTGLPCGTQNDYTLQASIQEPVLNFCGPASTNPNCQQATTDDSPGCQTAVCCNTVCGIDPFCCQAEWDADCATEATNFCNICTLDTSSSTFTEPEPCNENSNGGCNATPNAFTTITDGAIVHGTGFTGTGTRDTDWYRLTSTAADDINADGNVFYTARLRSEFPAVCFIINSAVCPVPAGATGVVAAFDSAGCVEDARAVSVAVGTKTIFVAPGTTAAGIFSGIPCAGGTLGNDYLLTVSVDDTLPPPPNDNCASATPIGNGNTNFSTLGATTEAATPALPPACDKVGDGGDLGSDIWYIYTATCTGNVTVSLCQGTGYDARIAVYPGGAACGALPDPVACADDSCGTFAGPPTTTFAATNGQTFRLRVGGFAAMDGGVGATGIGVINIACVPVSCPGGACPSNLNGDGSVNGLDIGVLLAAWSIPSGTPGCGGAVPCCANLNNDPNNVVDGLDIGVLLSDWSGIPGGDPDCPP